MGDVQKLLKMVSDGLKWLAQGVEAIAEKIDDVTQNKGSDRVPSASKSDPFKKAQTAGQKTDPEKAPEFKAAAQKEETAPKPESKEIPKKTAKSATAIDTVFSIISRSKDGVDTATIKAKTGYDRKKVANIVYKLKKQNKIIAVKKGVYAKL